MESEAQVLSANKNKMTPTKFFQRFGMLIVLLVIIVIVSCMTDKFLNVSNLLIVARQVSINGILALGVSFVILTGGIDLSVGSLLALTATMAYTLPQYGVPWGLAAVLGILIGIGFGLISGVLVAKLKIAPFITTLAFLTICRGITQVVTGGSPVTVPDQSMQWIGVEYLGPIPVPVIIMIAGFVLAWFVSKKTKFGRHVYAVGGNEQAAALSGVSVDKIKIAVYAISGFCCAISGYITAARLGSIAPIAGQGAELDAIAAVVLGGISLSGGKGNIIIVLVGAFIIGVLNNALNLLGVSAYWQEIAKGLVILAAVILDKVLTKGK